MNTVPIAATPRETFTRSENHPTGPGLLPFLRHLIALMTPGDRLLFFVLLGIGLLSILGVRRMLAPGETASVAVANRVVKKIPLAVEENHSVTGAIGPMTLRVSKNGVQVIHSQCPEKICIRQGAISRRGQLIVCVPNRMIVAIDGEKEHSLDAVTP